MKALEFRRNEARYAAAAVTARFRTGAGAKAAPLSLIETDAPELPSNEWVRVTTRLAGICSSDLATVEGRSSRYFEPWVSFPFVPGHEVVGTLADGTRVALEPVLGHEARRLRAAIPWCRSQRRQRPSPPRRRNHVEPGIQIGYCHQPAVAGQERIRCHPSQLHAVPDSMTVSHVASRNFQLRLASMPRSEAASSPAYGCHHRRRNDGPQHAGCAPPLHPRPDHRRWADTPSRSSSRRLGRPRVQTRRGQPSVRQATGSTNARKSATLLSGGADVVSDAVGSSASIEQAIAMTRPRRSGRSARHAGPNLGQLHRPLASRDRTRRRLHLRHRDAARRHPSPAFDAGDGTDQRPADLGRLVSSFSAER
ncbi:MAG: alcohol dehydrogenase catalytic domain-containing protein [Acidimicrobiales bacterium]